MKLRKFHHHILTATIAALIAAPCAQAASLNWDIATGDGAAITDGLGFWSEAAGNWNSAGVDVNWTNATPDDAVFGGGTLGTFGTVTLGSAITAGSLTFNTPNSGGAYTIDTATFGLTLNTGITANESATIQSGVGGSIVLGANNAWTVAATKTLAVSSAISGTGFGITKTGTGTLTLSNANSYTGQTTVTLGTLNASALDALGTGAPLLVNGGTLDITTFNNTVGAVTLTSGSISGTTGVLTGTSYAVESGTISAILAGSGVTLTKTTGGTVTLSGTAANTYTGDTTISLGTLTLAKSANVIAVAGNIIVNAGGTLATTTAASNQIADTASLTIAADGNFSTGIVDTIGTVTVTGGGSNLGKFNLGSGSNLSVSSLSLTDTISSTFYSVAANSANSTMTIGAGGLTMSNAIYQVAQTAGTNTAKIVLNGNVTTTGTSQLTTGGGTQIAQLDLGASARTFDITGTMSVAPTIIGAGGGINKIGSGTLTLSGVNTFNGTTTLTAGTLSVGTSANLGAAAANIVLDGGTLQITGTALANISGLGHAVSFNPTKTVGLDIASAAHIFTVDQVLNQTTGGFTKLGAGTMVLNQANTYTGLTTVTDGRLTATNGAALGAGGGLTVAADKSFVFAPTAAGALNLGAGVLTLGNGTTTSIGAALGGTASQSAITSTSAADLSGTGTVNIYGISGVAPAAGSNNLVTALSGLDGGTYSLGTVFNNTNFTVSGFARTPGAISVTATAATALSGSVFWKGGLAGNTGVWAASNGSTQSNWQVTDGVDQPLAPGATSDLVFSAATAPGTMAGMTLGADMTVRTVTVNDTSTAFGLGADGFTLTLTPASATTGLTMSSGVLAGTIGANVALGAAQTWTNNSANTLTVSGVVSGANDLTKAGTGSLALTAANTYSGATTINRGTIALSGSGTINASTGLTLNGGSLTLTNTSAAQAVLDRVSSAAITTNGGTLGLTNTIGANVYAETIGSVALTSGQTNFVFNNTQGASAGSQTLTLGGLTRTGASNTSSVLFASNSGLSATKNIMVVTGAGGPTIAGQIIGPWAYAGNTAGAFDYAIYDANNNVLGAGGTLVVGGEATWTVATDAYNNNVVTQTLGTATRTITALRNTAASAATLTLATGLNLETRGLLNGAITVFTVAPGTGGVLTTPSGGGNLHINAGNGTAGGGITINAPINNNGTVTLVKDGVGLLLLSSGTSNYSGGTVINAGQLRVPSDTALGNASGSITLNGGTLLGNSTNPQSGNGGGANIISARDVIVGVAGGSIGAHGNNNFTTTGVLSGSGTLTKPIITGSGGQTLNFNSLSNTFTGSLVIDCGNVSGAGNVVSFSSLLDSGSLGAGNLAFSRGATGTATGTLTYNAAATAALTLNNRQIELNNGNTTTALAATISNLNTTRAITVNTNLVATGVGAKTLTLSAVAGPTNAFAGNITDGNGGTVAVTIAGAGIWALSGANTYTGATTVTTGTLRIQHANALGATSGNTSVAGGATLQLQGAISYAAEPLTMAATNTTAVRLQSVSGNNTWNGPITVTGGADFVRISADADLLTLAGTVTGSAGSGIALQGAGNITVTGLVSGSANMISGATGAGVRTLSNDGNDFTGASQVSGGTLAFTSVADGGFASALGAGTGISLGNAANNGTLRYVGTAPGGHSSNRAINLFGTTGAVTIEANGAGPLVFTGTNTATGAGIKTLTLSGANTGSNSIGVIVDNSGTNKTSLTKDGVGTWVLGETNTYTGTTTVNAGTLLVNGSITGSTAIISGGILGGTGATGPVTINVGGSIAPGSSIDTLDTGSLTFNGGTFALEIDTTAVTTDLANVNGGLNLFGGAALTISDFNTSVTPLSIGQVFTFIDYSGVWDGGTFATYADDSVFTLGLNEYRISYDGVDNLTSAVTLQVIPEPGSAVLLLGGLAALAGVRRRRAN